MCLDHSLQGSDVNGVSHVRIGRDVNPDIADLLCHLNEFDDRSSRGNGEGGRSESRRRGRISEIQRRPSSLIVGTLNINRSRRRSADRGNKPYSQVVTNLMPTQIKYRSSCASGKSVSQYGTIRVIEQCRVSTLNGELSRKLVTVSRR